MNSAYTILERYAPVLEVALAMISLVWIVAWRVAEQARKDFVETTNGGRP